MTNKITRRSASGSRRSFLLNAAAGLLSLRAIAAELSDQEVLQALTTDPPRDKAIRRGLVFLQKQQSPDGSLGSHNKPALTSLAIMAFLSAGHTFEDPKFADWLRRSLRWVLSKQDASGYFGGGDQGRMYAHGICTLMLAEALGMTRESELEERIHRSLVKAVKVTVNAALIQKPAPYTGGWHYLPDAHTSDLSLSGWQLMSLHAAQQVGITVPQNVISGAVSYAKNLTTPNGQVGYQNRGEDHPALRGLGLLSLAIGDQLKAPEVAAISQRIQADPIKWQGRWFFYQAYYDAVGLSRSAPKAWETYSRHLETILVDHQSQDGGWPSPPDNTEFNEGGPVYVTSMSILALAVNRHVLPAYQR